MLSVENFGIGYVKSKIAKRAKERRLACNLSRNTLAERSGVAASTLKRFETTGEVSVDNLLRVAMALDCLGDFEALFPICRSFKTLDEMADRERKRGRK